MAVILDFSTLSGTDPQILPPNGYNKHTVIFIGEYNRAPSPVLGLPPTKSVDE